MPGYVRNRGKRNDGTTKWQARWRHPDNPNVRKEKQFRDKDVAKRWITRMDAEAHGAMFKQSTNTEPARSFAEAVAVWKEIRWPGLSPKTTARYGQVLRAYLEPEFGSKAITDLTHETCARYFARLTRDGKSAGTVRKVHTVLGSICSQAVRFGWLPTNPCREMDGLPPAASAHEAVFLTAAEVHAVAQAITAADEKGDTHPARAVMVYTAAYTGLRADELWALRRRDVDLLRGRITVERSIKALDGEAAKDGPLFGKPKNGKTRTIGLPAPLRALLAEHLTAPTSGGAGADALVFTSSWGAPVRQGLFYRRYFKPAVKTALPPDKHGCRWHDLRHTCAALLIAQGANPKQIKEHMGHASITTTMDRYGHLFDGHDDEMLAGLAAAFEAAATPPDNVAPLRAEGQ